MKHYLLLLLTVPFAACIDELEPSLGAVEQALTPAMLCGVYPNTNVPDQAGACVATDPKNVRQINYTYTDSSIPFEYRSYSWTITTNAHGGPSIADGCGNTNFCVLRLSAACVDRQYGATVVVRDIRSITVPAEQASALAVIPRDNCMLACTAPPATPPAPAIAMRCQGKFRASWPSVPAVNRYTMQAVPNLFPWSGAYTVFDTNGTSCNTQVAPTSPPWPTLLRLRMCNDCGCSDWGPSSSVVYDPMHECDI